MCRCCQSCLESCYWNCFEKRFCYDKDIPYYCEEHDEHHFDSMCYSTKGSHYQSNGHSNSSSDDVVLRQPEKAPKYNRQSSWLTESEFQREIQTNVPILAPNIVQTFANSQIFVDETKDIKKVEKKVPEKSNLETLEEEEIPEPVCDVKIVTGDVDSSVSGSTRSITKSESLISMDSHKLENKHLRHVMDRPKLKTSKSFLSVKDGATPISRPRPVSDGNIFTISNESLSISTQISLTPEIPVIGGNLPKFFLDTPEVSEYKEPTSLNDLKTPDVIFSEFDFSMPRYYRKSQQLTAPSNPDVHNSMPNIHSKDKDASKRLTQIRQKIKPLLIKQASHA